ncbi:MAG: cytochrome c [Deltaproteobacteria bacterium]|nr:cytochrome c [Deltaproteobacteria bacterium]
MKSRELQNTDRRHTGAKARLGLVGYFLLDSLVLGTLVLAATGLSLAVEQDKPGRKDMRGTLQGTPISHGPHHGMASPGGEQVAQGRILYTTYCLSCHGQDAAGQVPGKPMGGVNPDGSLIAPALDRSGHAWHHPRRDLFRVIKHGSSIEGSPMKGWSDKLSDQQITAIIAYFSSLWMPHQQSHH